MKTPFDQRKNNLDFVRLSLALFVIITHSYALGTGSLAREPVALVTRHQVTFGHVAVDLFFVVSGFLIAASAERSRTVWSFLKKRVFRIYPAFCVVAILSLLVFMPLSGATFPSPSPWRNAANIVGHTLTLREFSYQNAFPNNPFPFSIDGSLWSISYEFWCYIGVALLSVTGLLKSRRTLISLFAFSIAVSMAFKITGWLPGGKILGVIFGFPPYWARLLPMYLAGVVFYRVRDRIPIRPSLIIACVGLLILAGQIPFGWPLLFPIAGTYLVFAFAFHPSIPDLRAARFGDLSYGTYLYAFPVQQLIVLSFGHKVNPWLLFALASPATLLLALASWHGVERWFLRRSHQDAPSSPIQAELTDKKVVEVSAP